MNPSDLPTLREHFNSLPSAALSAMIEGLLAADADPQCVIDMSTFGSAADGFCFGCAATWTVQQACGRKLTPKEVSFLGGSRSCTDDGQLAQRWDTTDISRFEMAIDRARTGMLRSLFHYMDRRSAHLDTCDGRFSLQSDNWQSQLPAVRTLIAKLIAAGL